MTDKRGNTDLMEPDAICGEEPMRFFLEDFMDYLTDRHLLRNSLKVEGEYIRMELDTTALAKQFIEHRSRKIQESIAKMKEPMDKP